MTMKLLIQDTISIQGHVESGFMIDDSDPIYVPMLLGGGSFVNYVASTMDELIRLHRGMKRRLPDRNHSLAIMLWSRGLIQNLAGDKVVDTTTYEILATDANKTLYFTNAAGCAVTLQVNRLVRFDDVYLVQKGAAAVTLVAGAGVTFAPSGTAATAKLNAAIGLTGEPTLNTYLVFGQQA